MAVMLGYAALHPTYRKDVSPSPHPPTPPTPQEPYGKHSMATRWSLFRQHDVVSQCRGTERL